MFKKSAMILLVLGLAACGGKGSNAGAMPNGGAAATADTTQPAAADTGAMKADTGAMQKDTGAMKSDTGGM